jgi:hypothetical protein
VIQVVALVVVLDVLMDALEDVRATAALGVQEDAQGELMDQLLVVCNYAHILVVVIVGECKEDGINPVPHILIVAQVCVTLIAGHSVMVLALMVIRQLMHAPGAVKVTVLGTVICVAKVIVVPDVLAAVLDIVVQVVLVVVMVLALEIAVLDVLVAVLEVALVALQAVLTHVKMDVEAAVATVPVDVAQLVLMDAVIIALVHVHQVALGNALLLQMLKG